MSLTEVRGNLFTSSDSLVHCVSRDLHMGKGIATEFKKQFGGVDELSQQSKLVLIILWSLVTSVEDMDDMHYEQSLNPYVTCCTCFLLHY